MSVADNFDYSLPSLSKKDTLSLSTINSNDAKIRPFKKMDTQRDWSINLYNLDIEKGILTDLTNGAIIPIEPLPPVMIKLLQDGGLVEHIKKNGDFKLV